MSLHRKMLPMEYENINYIQHLMGKGGISRGEFEIVYIAFFCIL